MKEVNNNETSADGPIPVEDLIVFRGKMNGSAVQILKDDCCNTNILSRHFVERHPELFDVENTAMCISHSKRGSTEEALQVALNATLTMGDHSYVSNWAIADCRYDVLLGMPWHVACRPQVEYVTHQVLIKGNEIPLHTFDAELKCPKVSSIGIKKFRRLLRKKQGREDFSVFQVVPVPKEGTCSASEDLAGKESDLKHLLSKYATVFRDDLPPGLPPEREVDHCIETDIMEKPPHRPLYQLSPAELVAVKEYVIDLLHKGKIRRSKSPFGASLFFVKSKGALRAVVDYRGLNRITKKNNAPLSRPDEMFDRLGHARVFSKPDLKTGFHQIRVRPEDIEKTAFNTKYGQFEYLVMPMGLCNAPATFQSLMNHVFYDCIDVFHVVYMDDLLIFSRNEEDHLKHLEIVLSRLKSENLFVSRKKCAFMKEETEFLGMIVSKNVISVNPAKVAVIKTWPRPASLTELRSFVGLLQFFRQFTKGFSEIAAPMTALTRKGSGIHKWDHSCDVAFEALKESITTAPILIAPDWQREFRCHVDASQRAVGGTLTQLDDDGCDRVIAYFSRRLSGTEERYTANERELLGLVYFLKRFRCYLEGSSFEVFTDNQVLHNFFTKPSLNRKEARWLELLSQFGIRKVNLRPGRVHVLGDVLSRAPHIMEQDLLAANATSAVSLDIEFGEQYAGDQMFGPIVRAFSGEWSDDPVQKERTARLLPLFKFEKGLLYYNGKVCVPRICVRDVLGLAHDLTVSGHFAFRKTIDRLHRYHWKHKTRDVMKYCEGCQICKQKKEQRNKKLTDPTPPQIPKRRWGSVATDFIVSLPRTPAGFDAITTYVDRLSRRVHFTPSKTKDTAVDAAESFFVNVFKHHGLPDDIVSDRDAKFTSRFWRELMKLCGVRTNMSTS